MRTVSGRVHIGAGEEETAEVATEATYDTLEAFLEALQSVADAYDVLLQAFDARYVADEAHLQAALDHAKRSMAQSENVAEDLAVEVLLYTAGRRQIDEAMELGLATGTQSVIVLLDGDAETAAAAAVRERIDPGPVEPDESTITDYFEISRAERSVTTADLSALVRERVALLDVDK